MAQQQQQAPQPFLFGARAHYQFADEREYVPGREVIVPLPETGLVNMLVIRLSGQWQNGADVGYTLKNDVEGAWNLIKRCRIEGNGSTPIVDLTGFELFQVNHALERGYKPGAPGVGSSAPDPEIFRGLSPTYTLGSTQKFAQVLFVPIAANNGNEFDTGLVNLQAEQLTMTARITFSALDDIFNAAPSGLSNCRIEMGYLWYELPPPGIEAPPPQIIRTFSAEYDAKTGDNPCKADRQGRLLQAFIASKVNGDYDSEKVQKVTLRLGRNVVPYEYKGWENRIMARKNLGVDLPEGCHMMNYWHPQQDVSTGNTRDAWDLTQYAKFEHVVTLSGVTDSENSSIRIVYRVLDDIQL
jgi:hypothetical protein